MDTLVDSLRPRRSGCHCHCHCHCCRMDNVSTKLANFIKTVLGCLSQIVMIVSLSRSIDCIMRCRHYSRQSGNFAKFSSTSYISSFALTAVLFSGVATPPYIMKKITFFQISIHILFVNTAHVALMRALIKDFAGEAEESFLPLSKDVPMQWVAPLKLGPLIGLNATTFK